MKTILDNDFVVVEFHETEALVQMTWKKISGKLPIEEYQNAFNVAIDFQEDNKDKIRNFMSDIREQAVLSPDYRKWFQENAMPRAVENGIKLGAVLFNGNVFQKYYLNNIMNTTKKFGLKFKFFNKREDAMKWFEETN